MHQKAHHLLLLLGEQTRGDQRLQGSARQLLAAALILTRCALIDRVVEPRRQNQRQGSRTLRAMRVEAVQVGEHLRKVPAVVVGAVRLLPRLQQALTQLRHLRRELSPQLGRSLHELEAGRIEAGCKRRLPGAKQTRANLLGALLQRNAQTARNERSSQLRAAELLRARPH